MPWWPRRPARATHRCGLRARIEAEGASPRCPGRWPALCAPPRLGTVGPVDDCGEDLTRGRVAVLGGATHFFLQMLPAGARHVCPPEARRPGRRGSPVCPEQTGSAAPMDTRAPAPCPPTCVACSFTDAGRGGQTPVMVPGRPSALGDALPAAPLAIPDVRDEMHMCAGHAGPVGTRELCPCGPLACTEHTHERDSVPVELYLQKQVAGRLWPAGRGQATLCPARRLACPFVNVSVLYSGDGAGQWVQPTASPALAA